MVSRHGVLTWIVTRLSHLDLNHCPIANFLHPFANEATPKAQAILVKADQLADALGLDGEVIDGVMVVLDLGYQDGPAVS
jgi:hypothetical protein